jgi:hypothetical protein
MAFWNVKKTFLQAVSGRDRLVWFDFLLENILKDTTPKNYRYSFSYKPSIKPIQ